MAACDYFFPVYPVESTGLKCKTPRQNRRSVLDSQCRHTLQDKHGGLMAFCFSFGVDEKDSATVSGVRQPFPVFIDLSQNKAEKKEREKKKIKKQKEKLHPKGLLQVIKQA